MIYTYHYYFSLFQLADDLLNYFGPGQRTQKKPLGFLEQVLPCTDAFPIADKKTVNATYILQNLD